MKILTKLAIENLLPISNFYFRSRNLAPKVANNFGINLVFYGENEGEYGNPIADNYSSLRKSYFQAKITRNYSLSGKN